MALVRKDDWVGTDDDDDNQDPCEEDGNDDVGGGGDDNEDAFFNLWRLELRLNRQGSSPRGIVR